MRFKRMTNLLQDALDALAQLPVSEQDALAAIVLEELASEQRWSQSLANSRDQLSKLALEALAEYKTGGTKPL